ncbi:hypothetical protein [uncultured Hymenobacter sp.]|uniref:hypothetical protein n=1 Tax=uncultured Hymenobacter sp. TaxID=170016 RepID=UPI0035CC7F4B
MKLTLLITKFALPGLLLLGQEGPHSKPASTSPVALRMPAPPTGTQLAGTVLAAPYQVVRSLVGGRVTRVYFNEGQAVKSGAVLLKLAVGAGPSSLPVFASAPVAGDLTNARVKVGQYLAAGTPYARLAPRGPVWIRMATAAAARLRSGDSLRIITGPAGLAGVVTPLTALLPGPDSSTVVLVLGQVGWPPGTAVEVVVAPLRPLPNSGITPVN